MAAPKRLIRMVSTKSKYFYTTTKNNKNTPEKLKLRRFDPVVRKHVEFEEKKIK